MCGDDGECCDLQIDRYIRARKEHRCAGCDYTIRRGDRYHYQKQLLDGSFEEWRHCLRCWTMIMALLHQPNVDWIEYGLDCGEDWVQNFGPLPPEVERLAFMPPDEAQDLFKRNALVTDRGHLVPMEAT